MQRRGGRLRKNLQARGQDAERLKLQKLVLTTGSKLKFVMKKSKYNY